MNISMPDTIKIELPPLITIPQPYVYLLFWWIGILLFTLILKYIFKGPLMKDGIISALSILIFYVASVLIYIFNPLGLDRYRSPLPFLDFREDSLWLVVYEVNEQGKLCVPEFFSQVASMWLLAFLVNYIYSFKPGNLKIPAWLVLRLGGTVVCFVMHYAVLKVLNKFISMIPEESFVHTILPYLPIAFLGALLVLYILGALKGMMKYFFKIVNITYEGLYGFFFKNKFGVIVTRAIYSTVILTLFAYGLQKVCAHYFLAPFIPLSALSLAPTLALVGLFILWILVGFKL